MPALSSFLVADYNTLQKISDDFNFGRKVSENKTVSEVFTVVQYKICK